MTFDNVFNVNHAGVAVFYDILLLNFSFSVPPKCLFFILMKFLPMFVFTALSWIESQYFSFYIYTLFGCTIILIDIFYLFAVFPLLFSTSLYTYFNDRIFLYYLSICLSFFNHTLYLPYGSVRVVWVYINTLISSFVFCMGEMFKFLNLGWELGN